MKPDISTKENPIKAQRIISLDKEGFLEMDKRQEEKIRPTPTATPTKQRTGILEARYLNPSKIISQTETFEIR